ncbi:substrate-binding domain-containing protein [Actinoplanes sp. NPDC051851]|uniref:substrate-binding domain-containing protein n=1 Tax=Actinoplanes sp. NPDC051851 TaxID=3154753 RepID=UPI00342E487A
MNTSDKRGPLAATRKARLLEALQRDGVLRISDLTDTLGAAAVTIRRDIAQLAAEGLVERVHGGVALPSPMPSADPPDGDDAGAIGMLVPSLDYYWPAVARGAESAAREMLMRVVLRGSSYVTEDDQPQLARLVEQGVEGLIVAPRMDVPSASRTTDWLADTGMPVVLVERTATAGPHHAVLESVVTDHSLGAAMAVRHLAGLGHRKVGLVLAKPSPTGPHVRRGWLEGAAECGLDVTTTVDTLVPDAPDPGCAAALDEVLEQCLSTGTTALLVHADAEAIALVQRCEERGLAVPGALSVVSYDDEVAGLFSPALTAVRPPCSEIGRAAVRLILDRLNEPDRPTHRIVISPALRVRDSSAAPRVSRPPG